MDAPPEGAAAGGGVRVPHRLRLAAPAGWSGWAVAEGQFGAGETTRGSFKGGGAG